MTKSLYGSWYIAKLMWTQCGYIGSLKEIYVSIQNGDL